MVYTQLKRTLEGAGVTEIDAFGPGFRSVPARGHVPQTNREADEGTVLEQTRKGYRLRDRLLRAASVVVAAPVGEEEEDTEE
ncbi:MAG: hypothetical protein CM1200mP34_1800 [Verrucomicrobiales bacterium]|nr:MAG: hypothetical protein CM1200mP34_1800 [Verrucomicrobiales bacterium]